MFFQSLESFLIDSNATDILHENKSTGELSEKSRRKLIKHLHEYLSDTFGDDPSPNETKMLAKAAIHLFPCLEVQGSSNDGIVSNIY